MDQLETIYSSLVAESVNRDNMSMKTIAYLGMVYLPFGLIAQVFDIGFFHYPVPKDDHLFGLEWKALGVMIATATVLTGATFLVWMSLKYASVGKKRYLAGRLNRHAGNQSQQEVKPRAVV